MYAVSGNNKAYTGGVNMQEIMFASENYSELDRYFTNINAARVFLVCGKSLGSLKLGKYFDEMENRTGIGIVRFSDFSPNPKYGSAVAAAKAFRESNCGAIVAVGGGSAIDVAKCVKAFVGMELDCDCLAQRLVPNKLPFLAVPTTAGTGSEATGFSVIYKDGEKQSVEDESLVPSAVLFDAAVLKSLPEYHKKSAMLDALCHAVEAAWSVHSTDESRGYSRQAIKLVAANAEAYLSGDSKAAEQMMRAAYLAGKAINIARTTAGHAMCYKLTMMYGLAHGHATALCNAVLIPYMLKNTDDCIDKRGKAHLDGVFADIAESMGCATPNEMAEKFSALVSGLGLERPEPNSAADIGILTDSVNEDRLGNFPIKLTKDTLVTLYGQILKS